MNLMCPPVPGPPGPIWGSAGQAGFICHLVFGKKSAGRAATAAAAGTIAGTVALFMTRPGLSDQKEVKPAESDLTMRGISSGSP